MKPDTEGSAKREVGRRRRFSKEFKRQVVEETLAGDSSVTGVALRHRLNANLVFTWRRKQLRALAATQAKSVKMLPVSLIDCGGTVPGVAAEPNAARKPVRRSKPRRAPLIATRKLSERTRPLLWRMIIERRSGIMFGY